MSDRCDTIQIEPLPEDKCIWISIDQPGELVQHKHDVPRACIDLQPRTFHHALDSLIGREVGRLFGMVLTLLIALEFKHSLMVVLHDQRNVVQTRAVILIALLAIVRRFIVLDLYQTAPSTVAALASAALALGIVFWLVRSQEYPDVMGEGQKTNLPS